MFYWEVKELLKELMLLLKSDHLLHMINILNFNSEKINKFTIKISFANKHLIVKNPKLESCLKKQKWIFLKWKELYYMKELWLKLIILNKLLTEKSGLSKENKRNCWENKKKKEKQRLKKKYKKVLVMLHNSKKILKQDMMESWEFYNHKREWLLSDYFLVSEFAWLYLEMMRRIKRSRLIEWIDNIY
jgi:hypothetical protein